MFDVYDGCDDGGVKLAELQVKVSHGSSKSTLSAPLLKAALFGTARPLACLMLI